MRRLEAVALALVLALPLVSCEEAIEAQLCKSASGKICDKWFDCWPIISAGLWDTLGDCKLGMRAACDNSEAWSDCDVDNDALRDCDDAIEGSPCGELPDSCYDIADCYDANN
ncbi:MAG: hypothetical protein JRI68_04315 [Deltaproteobacteria bacterium]|nr:hypothetical protein [Deltaproteobacteria bacterium]